MEARKKSVKRKARAAWAEHSAALPRFSLKTMIASIAVGMAAASCYMTLNQDVHPSVLDAGFRYAEVDGYFAKFKRSEIIDMVRLPILNDDMEVQIVESVRGADYGFVESRYPLDRFWVQAHGYHVHVYDEHHLFVIISDWYVNTRKREEAIAAQGQK